MNDFLTNILTNIITDVLAALYQPFGFSLLTAVLLMFLYLYAKEKGSGSVWSGLKIVCRNWKDNFLKSSLFRRLFALCFYVMMILFQTLLNRELWMNPLSNVMGGWTLEGPNGELTTESIENLILFIPFSILLLWVMNSDEKKGEKTLNKGNTLGTVLWQSARAVFLFSLSIELLQLLLRLGTFQLSDLFYNTVGGCIGGVVYWIGYRIKHL